MNDIVSKTPVLEPDVSKPAAHVDEGTAESPASHKRFRLLRRIGRSISALFDRLRPRSFRAKLTLAISIVFLLAIGAATLVQTIVVNGMFSYALTISTYEKGELGGADGTTSGSTKGPGLEWNIWQWDPQSYAQAHPDSDSSADSSSGSDSDSMSVTGSSSGGIADNKTGSASGTLSDGHYRVEWGQDGSYTINTPYGISIWNQDTIANGLRISAAIIFVFFGTTSILVIWIVTSRMSRRLRSISEQAAALDPDRLDTRIDVDRRTHPRRRWFRRHNSSTADAKSATHNALTHDDDSSTAVSSKESQRHGDADEIAQLANALNGMLERIQAASVAEKRFVSNASHELRTPIAAVETNLDAPLAQGRFPADVEPSVRRALAANRRGAQLVQALLTLSRIQNGAIGGHAAPASNGTASSAPSVANLTDCVNDAIDIVADDAAEHGITIDADELPKTTVATDPALLELAVGNLIRNAVVHNSNGGSVRVAVSQPSANAAGGSSAHVTLTVTNTTSETLPDDLNELTQPFHRGEHSRISAVPGVGLGLSIVSAACEAMGARLTLSQPSDGLFRATLDLPAA
ncbi:Integral membrane sensor signal transduction histidine kinase [Bifidobacterium goeldii]|uniref:histidine kinase n=1 Tax=Bifidobacterium goeldii TaxID=2306975 RepID=A0A430FLX7_9BIFI|nr:HAMP domain-containing sensor histidine kinase [Bifidobacterium goeldii]RSX53702.1 Integral membrane sensor signal transduction histidine kinase [Bifidobacterium goeldii]